MLINNRDSLQESMQFPRSPIHPFARLSQYCSHDYQQLLAVNGFICSMSKRGYCYNNASMESRNHSFKVDAIHGEKFSTRAFATYV